MIFEDLKSNIKFLKDIDRIHYLIDLSKKNEGIPDNLKNDNTKIHGCVSTSFLIVDNTEPLIKIRTDSDSTIVKGLLFILTIFVNEKTKTEILEIDEKKLMEDIGMKNIITSQRTNGFYASILKLKEIIKNVK